MPSQIKFLSILQEQTRLINAAQEGDINDVKSALLNGTPVDCKDDVRKKYLCHTAVQSLYINLLPLYLSLPLFLSFILLLFLFYSLCMRGIFISPLFGFFPNSSISLSLWQVVYPSYPLFVYLFVLLSLTHSLTYFLTFLFSHLFTGCLV